MSDAPILNLPQGLEFHVTAGLAHLEPLQVQAGEWIAITPEDSTSDDPTPPLARLLVTLGSPKSGTIELHGKPLRRLSYVKLQHLRTEIGFVVCRGGLLSNRTLAENVGLPLSVHAHLRVAEEKVRVAELLEEFALTRVAAQRPDDVDGATRFRTCVARALVLQPPWVVIEGTGDFLQPGSRTWDRLEAYRASSRAAIAVCLSAPDPRFEEWLAARGGRVLRYRTAPERPVLEAI